MKWSFRICRIAGIDVFMHATFLLLLAWVGYSEYANSQDWMAVLNQISFVLILFGIVVLHELGHALAARRYGVQTRDITLLPIGGVARLERMPREPRQELVIALAGPAVNVVIAALCAAWIAATGESFDPLEVASPDATLVQQLLWINTSLIVFNMLPAFPMDGGRVLRALLAMKFSHARETRIAASIGQGMALLFAVLGIFFNATLILVALFVWMGAAQEGRAAKVTSRLDGIPVARAMITDFHTLSPHDPLTRAIAMSLEGFQADFPIVQDGRLVGMLSRATLLEALEEWNENLPVGEVMDTELVTVEPRDMLPAAFEKLQAAQVRSLPVVLQDEVVGMVTLDNLGEFLTIQAALARRARAARNAADHASPGLPARRSYFSNPS